ncbi:MAG: FliA/WhiG family RNA polymerase sigma factor [Eubacteriales bacterium]|nr:FliA/WhiG family RNA polymerase sigma factor [Eubacteriales bacterium]
MPAADVDELWSSYQNNPTIEIKNQIVMAYVPLVNRIVARLTPLSNTCNGYDDLIGYGVIGLIDSVDRFDPARGIRFESFAAKRIKGEIIDNIRKQDWASASLRSRIKQIGDAYDALEAESAEATDEKVAEKLGLTVEQVERALEKAHIFNIIRFEAVIGNDDDHNLQLENMVAGNAEETPENALQKKELAQVIAGEIEKLTPNERRVIVLYYYEELMLKEIADILHVTSARVSQIHSKALLKLRLGIQKQLGEAEEQGA